MGVDLITGYSGDEFLFDDKGAVVGIRTKERGINAQGEKTADYEDSISIQAKLTVLAEGARGSMTLKGIQHFKLDQDSSP